MNIGGVLDISVFVNKVFKEKDQMIYKYIISGFLYSSHLNLVYFALILVV